MATIQKSKASAASIPINKHQEKIDLESNENQEKQKDEILEGARNNEESPKQNPIPVMKPQFRMNESDGHKTIEYRYTEEVEHTMITKDGVTWHELKQYDHNPISNGQVVSPDVRKATVTKSIGDRQYQTSEITIDGVKKIEQLSKLSDADIEDFKTEWESNWKPSINEKQMNENMAKAIQQIKRNNEQE